MKAKALNTVLANNMFARGDKLLAAVSGGADSVALLHFLCSLSADWNVTVGALHLNHLLRGEESDRDEAFVRALCREMQVPLAVERADVRAAARSERGGIEACGRRLRYGFFAREAERQGAKIAVAHTRCDSAETMLLNLVRGSALRGLTGIPPVRGKIIRPLIDCTRNEVERYCAANDLSFVTDSTNHSDDYARNRIRRHVMPLLMAENPRFLEHMAQTAGMLRTDADFLDAISLNAMDALCLPDGGVDRAGFLALPQALRGRVLVELLRRSGLEADSMLAGGLSALIESGRGQRQLARGLMFRCDEQVFYFEHIMERQSFFSVRILPEKMIQGEIFEVYFGKRVKITVSDYKNFIKTQYFKEKDLNYCLDYDTISRIVTLRQRLPADKLRPLGRGCAKTLKNLFQELGVPVTERLRRIVAADENGALWVEGIGPDERAAVTGETRRVLIFEITED